VTINLATMKRRECVCGCPRDY